MSSPETSLSTKRQGQPIVDATGTWTGIFWGTNRGVASAELAVNGQNVSGKLWFAEDVGQYEADLSGTAEGNRITAELKNFRSQVVTGLPQSGTFHATLTDTTMEGEWTSTTGVSGKVTLLRVKNPPQKIEPPQPPAALITKNVELGCYRLDKSELITVVNTIHEGTNVPLPLVGVSWDGHTVQRIGIQAMVDDSEVPAVVRSLSVIVNEPNLNLGGRSIYLNLKDKDPSTLVVNGNDQLWVDGKVAQIKRVLSHAEVKAVKYVRRFGPELNSLIFLALLAFLPSVDSLWHRVQIISATFMLLLSLVYAWKLPSNTKIFVREVQPTWWQRYGSTFLLGIFNVALGGLITFLIKKYVH